MPASERGKLQLAEAMVLSALGLITFGIGANVKMAATKRNHPTTVAGKALQSSNRLFDSLKKSYPDRVFQTGAIREISTSSADVYAVPLTFDGNPTFIVFNPATNQTEVMSGQRLDGLTGQTTPESPGRTLNP